MLPPITRRALIDSLLREVAVAQASFHSIQLAAWRELASSTVKSTTASLAALDEVVLELHVKPYRPCWLRRLWSVWRHKPEPSELQYRICGSNDAEAMAVRLRVARTAKGYEATVEPDVAMG